VITVKKPSLSLNKSFKVSSTEAGLGNIASNAIDGIESSRWSSTYKDPQWYQIDLGKAYDISSVVIVWEAASAKSYDIEESNDGENWIAVVSKTGMKNGARVDSLNNLKGGARYIRMFGVSRTTAYGYSIFEFEVFGQENSNAKPIGIPSSHGTTAIGIINSGDLSVFPSVVGKQNDLRITSPGYQKGLVQIYNLQGVLMQSFNYDGSNATVRIDQGFSSGIYLVKFVSEQHVLSGKFLVQ
jgi:hypothetical protein